MQQLPLSSFKAAVCCKWLAMACSYQRGHQISTCWKVTYCSFKCTFELSFLHLNVFFLFHFSLSVFWNIRLSNERKWHWNCLVHSSERRLPKDSWALRGTSSAFRHFPVYTKVWFDVIFISIWFLSQADVVLLVTCSIRWEFCCEKKH